MINFYEWSVKLLGELPIGYEFVYVLGAIIMFGGVVAIFVGLPLKLLSEMSKFR